MKKAFYLFLSLFLIVSQVSGQDNPVAELEAEDGILAGVSVQTSYTGYSGTGYVANFSGDGDQLKMTIALPQAGMYTVYVRYGGFWGPKMQEILINDIPASKIDFPETNTFQSKKAGTYYFIEGENTITIRKDWGYIAIDKLQVFHAEENEFDVDIDLVDSRADERTQALYSFLRDQFGERVISGQTSSYFTELSALAGQTPLLQVGDLSSYTEGYPYLWKNGGHTFGATDDGTVSDLISWSRSKGGQKLVSLQWHWHSPSGGVVSENNFYTTNTDFDVREAVKPGTEEYELIIRDIDAIAVQLKRFEDAGVPVLWRPLHEAGGGWFWWGAHGPEPCLQLYDIIFERLMIHHEIHNLIWVWSTPEEEWYPGNEKVDIIGYDSYPGSYNYNAQRYWFDQLYDVTEGKKLIAMTENGPIPDIDACFERGAPWLYFMSWSKLVAEQNSTEHLQEVFSHPAVITAESNNTIWRSSLYPNDWVPGFKDEYGRFFHDFSYAGYHLGEDSIPFITENIVDVTEAPYNADNSGTDDVTTILQDALDDVGASGGGVVYLPAGTYRIREASSTAGANAALHMKYDNVVLRGEGPESTFIYHDQANLRQKDIVHIRKAWSKWDEKRGTQTLLRNDILEPTRVLPVESVSGFSVGDLIVVRNDMTTAFASEHKMEGIWDNSYLPGAMFLRKIDSIDVNNRFLIIDIPTRYYLKTRDNARVYHAGEHIMECGIENLSFGNKDNPKAGWGEEDYSVSGTGAYDVHASHMMQFKYAQDCWVRNVHTYKPAGNIADIEVLSNCLLMYMSRNITVDSCDFQKSQYEGGGGNGYMYTFSGNDCLIKNSRANDSRHNYDFKYPFCSGNVILKCRGENSKYSSDFHMYLSMANLIDGFIVDGDYLECAFRPYGGTVLHGYPSTQSVFYNTYGENYHVDRNYILDSRQFAWGYVCGTSGPADQIKTTPVSGSQGGYTYDTSPEDYVEGVGDGELLRPVSLYLDQLDRRLNDFRPAIRVFDVKVEVADAFTDELLEGATVLLNDSVKTTNSEGIVEFKNILEIVTYSAEKENYLPLSERTKIIYTDTTFYVLLEPVQYDVSIQVLDSNTGEAFWGASVTFNDDVNTTNSEGITSYTFPAGTYSYLIEKLSYESKSGSLNIESDTSFVFYLDRTHAYIKFKLFEGVKPINNAMVSIGTDSLLSNNLGQALFSDLPVNTQYVYSIRREDYKDVAGNISLLTDTTLMIEMQIDTLNSVINYASLAYITPNPTKDLIYVKIPENQHVELLQILDIQGRVIWKSEMHDFQFTINMESYEHGIYLLQIRTADRVASHTIIKH